MAKATRDTSRCILVIEDEDDIRELLGHNLRKEGYEVVTAASGAAGLEAFLRALPRLIVLDLMLPDLPGLEVCRRIRGHRDVAQPVIIILTARTDEIDRVVGFEVGADDYVAKPFSMRELMLRVRTRLAHAEPPAPAPAVPARSHRRLVIGPITIDPAAHRVSVDGEEVSLSLAEIRLLLRLAEANGGICKRSELLTDVWQYNPGVESRTVDTHVKRLRDKLGKAGDLIQTVRGIGYRLAATR